MSHSQERELVGRNPWFARGELGFDISVTLDCSGAYEALTDLRITQYHEDEGIMCATARDGHPRIRVYRPDCPAVVLGRGSNPEIELNVETCLADEVPIYRRRGGGCAVLIDPGNVIVSVALPGAGVNHTRHRFAALSEWLREHLLAAGFVGLHGDGTFDLTLENRKVGGCCVFRTWGLMHFSTTLLFEPDLDRLERYLKHPPREPAYRRGRRHRDFLGHLPVENGLSTIENFIAELEDRLTVDSLPS